MQLWITRLWGIVRTSLWFVPSLMIIGAIALSYLLPFVDDRLRLEQSERFGFLMTTGEAGRLIMSSLAGAMITVAGVVFSLTMVSLSIAASQYGSRLLRTFMEDRITQFSLGAFLATSIYCLMVLRTIEASENGKLYVPHLSIAVGVLMSLISLGAVIYFIHHIAESAQAQSVISGLAADLDHTIDRLFPEKAGESPAAVPEPEPPRPEQRTWKTVPASGEGYLQAVEPNGLLQLAGEAGVVLQLLVRPGDFVIREQPLVRCSPEGSCGDELTQKINRQFLYGPRRTPRQDLRYAINELVELAMRALSPGINDPFSAMSVLDRLAAALSRLAARTIPSPYRYDAQGQLRLIVQPVTFPEALHGAINHIRVNAARDPVVTQHLLHTLSRIAPAIENAGDAAALLHQAERVYHTGQEHGDDNTDRERLRQIREDILNSLRRFDLDRADGQNA